MRYLLNKESSIKAIANAIRAKTGSNAMLTVADMPIAISNISGGGEYVLTVDLNTGNYNYNNSEEIIQENGDQGFADAIEAFAAGYQVIIHLIYSGSNSYSVFTVCDVADGSSGYRETTSQVYYNVGGTRFLACRLDQGCVGTLFITNDGSWDYGGT